MVKSGLTPAYPHSLEALLDEPLTRTLDHPTPNRQSQSLVLRIVDMIPMPLQVRIQCHQSIPCGVRQALDLQGLAKVCQDPIRLAMPPPVSCPAKPPTRLGGAAVEPSRRPLPEVLHSVVKVQDAHGRGRQTLIIQPPQAAGTITEPDHLGGRADALAHGFQPQTRLERIDIPQDRHQPTLAEPGDDLAGARAMLAQAGQHSHCDFVPSGLPRRLAAYRAKRDHHPIGAPDQGGGGQIGRQRLWRRQVAWPQSVQVLLECLHHVWSSRLHPPPHRLWTDSAPTIPAQQAGGSRKRHKDRQGTAQRLEFPAGPLMRLHSQGLIQGGHLWGHRPTRRRHWIGPNRLVIWRFAKPLLRKPAPHCEQRGQSVGCRARSVSTASTRWTVSTRATCHAAKINAEREGASSTALSRRCTAGSLGRMLSCRHSIGHRSPLEPVAKESKSVPHSRCYARSPRTAMFARFRVYKAPVRTPSIPESTRCSWPLHQVPTRPNCSPHFLNTESSPTQVHCQRLRVAALALAA